MELIGTLSNSRVEGMLDRLTEVLARFAPRLGTHRAVISERRPAQGEVMRAIKAVLSEHPEGLRTVEVRALVAQCLGRPVLDSTVKSALARSAAFDRVSRGRYRLRPAEEPSAR